MHVITREPLPSVRRDRRNRLLGRSLTKRWIFDTLGMPHQRPSRWLVDEVFGFDDEP